MQDKFLVHVFYTDSRKDTYTFPTGEKADKFCDLMNDDADVDFCYVEEVFTI